MRDTGVGIPAEMLAAVFDLFTQVDRSLDRSQGGLGIGLTLVRRLVEMHGGTVEATATGRGRGASSWSGCRCWARRRRRRRPRRPGGPRRAGCLRVLVVDDNVDAADSLAALLRLAGHEIRVAHDGPGALEAAAAFRPEVVVLDIGLPGLAATRWPGGCGRTRTCRGVPGGGDRLRPGGGPGAGAAAGFDHHLVKPVAFAELLKLLTPPVAAPAGR